MISPRRLPLGALAICLIVWAVLGWGIAPALWAQGVPSTQRDTSDTSVSSENVSRDTAIGAVEEGVVDSEPTNSAFYQPSLHYPSDWLMNSLPRLQRFAWVWSIIVVIMLAVLTWPLNEVEALCLERELQQTARGRRLRMATLEQDNPHQAAVAVVERQVHEDATGVDAFSGREVDSVPLLHHWRRFGGGNAEAQPHACSQRAAQETAPIPEFEPSPLVNPLRLFNWRGAARESRLPLTERRVVSGLHIIACEAELGRAVREVVLDLLRHESGCVAVATSEFDQALIAFALAGVEDGDRSQRMLALRRNAHLLKKSLSRLLFPRGQRVYMAEFLRQLERSSRKRGVAAVVVDMSARYEIGALPRIMALEEWLLELHKLAIHGNFPLFLVAPPDSLSSAWPYPRYRWTAIEDTVKPGEKRLSSLEPSVPDFGERG